MRPGALAREVLLPPVLAGAVVVGMLCGLAAASGDRGASSRSALAPVTAHSDLAVVLAYGPVGDAAATRATLAERARPWRLLGAIAPAPSTALLMPVAGAIGPCGHFGCPRPGHVHNGVDFLAPTGTPIRASGAGRVTILEEIGESGGYGNFVCIQHRADLATCYAHLSAVAARVRLGTRLRRGEVIGLVGSTGSSSAPHLHFEVRRGPASCSACAVDPIAMLFGGAPEKLDVPRMARASSDVPRRAAPAEVVAPVTEPVVATPQVPVEPRRHAPDLPPQPPAAAPNPQSGGAVPELNPASQAAPPEPQPAAPPAATTATTPATTAPAAPPEAAPAPAP